MSSPYDNLSNINNPKETNMVKSIFASKTLWMNLIAGVVSVITMITGSDIVAANPEVGAYGVTAIAVLNIIMRFFTKVPVKV